MADDGIKFSAYFVKGVMYHLKDKQVSEALKNAAVQLDYPRWGIPREAVDTHSL